MDGDINTSEHIKRYESESYPDTVQSEHPGLKRNEINVFPLI